jgi:hypothetical protein
VDRLVLLPSCALSRMGIILLVWCFLEVARGVRLPRADRVPERAVELPPDPALAEFVATACRNILTASGLDILTGEPAGLLAELELPRDCGDTGTWNGDSGLPMGPDIAPAHSLPASWREQSESATEASVFFQYV